MRRIACLVIVALVSCTGADAEVTGVPSASPSAAPARPEVFVRTCDSSVSGDLGSRWREGQIMAGPVVFLAARGYADDPPSRFSAPGALATSQKVLIVVGGDRPVTVSVRHPDAALTYDPARWGARNVVRFSVGEPRVTFEPCGDDQRWTQFNGGFLLRGPACVPVEVRVEGDIPEFATLSFGAGECD